MPASSSPFYLPPAFAAESPLLAWELAEEYPFGLLLGPDANITPLPWLIDREKGVLRAHLAAANPMVASLVGEPVTVVFQGPDGYVSPLWYRQPREHVPTWNYALAVAKGRAERLSRARTLATLGELCARFEAPDGYRMGWLDRAFLDELLDEIVGIEVRVESFTAKFKLSQNRTPEDRAGVMQALEAGQRRARQSCCVGCVNWVAKKHAPAWVGVWARKNRILPGGCRFEASLPG